MSATDIHPHQFRRAPELGDHVCEDCPLGEAHNIHKIEHLDVPERYEVERPEEPQ